jgi:hypothetical protein
MINDYSEVMATKQKDLSRLNDALANKDWHNACLIANKLESDFNRLYEYCANELLKAEMASK